MKIGLNNTALFQLFTQNGFKFQLKTKEVKVNVIFCSNDNNGLEQNTSPLTDNPSFLLPGVRDASKELMGRFTLHAEREKLRVLTESHTL